MAEKHVPEKDAQILLKQLFEENIEQDSWLNNYKKPAKTLKQMSNPYGQVQQQFQQQQLQNQQL